MNNSQIRQGGYLLMFSLLLSGCSIVIASATVHMTENLSKAILNNNDLKTVEDGAPAYLLMMDSLISGEPDNEALLRSGALLYAAYSDVFVTDKERALKLTDKALGYAVQCWCVRKPEACSLRNQPVTEFTRLLQQLKLEDVPTLYALGVSWAGWISARRDDFNAIADIAKVEAVMKRVVELNDRWQDGGAYLYLGAMETFLPPALGGKPETGKQYFEKALEISGGKNLMIRVVYARQYARLMFDRPLHDRLLHEVLQAKPDAPGYTLINTLAQKEAKALLNSADEYF